MAALSYLDASAIAKFIVRESESDAVESYAANREALLSSRLSALEVRRTVGRRKIPRAVEQVAEALQALFLLDTTDEILALAGTVGPPELRTLDAIHLATAMEIRDPELEFVTYDHRLVRAAEAAGLKAVHPGMLAPPRQAPRARR